MNKYLYDIITSQGTLSIEDIFLRIAISEVFAIIVFISLYYRAYASVEISPSQPAVVSYQKRRHCNCILFAL